MYDHLHSLSQNQVIHIKELRCLQNLLKTNLGTNSRALVTSIHASGKLIMCEVYSIQYVPLGNIKQYPIGIQRY